MMEKEGVSKVFDVFNKGRKEGHLATLENSTWSPFENDPLALGGCSTHHQQSTKENQGLTSF
jgi:hypothetical protein